MVNDLPSRPRPAGRIDWGQVGLLFWREMRAALRERNIIINSILLPIVLYPLILWGAFSGIMFVQGQTEGFASRLVVPQWPASHPELKERLLRDPQIRVLKLGSDLAEIRERIALGRLDALVEIEPAATATPTLPDNFSVRITYNKSKDRSAAAQARVKDVIDRYKSEWLQRTTGARGLQNADWHGFSVTMKNVASAKQTGALILGMMLPMFFLIMVALGTLHPAVDSTAGERERNTWETSMTLAASRVSIVTAKYLYVATLGGVAGLLNLVAMAVTMKPIFAPMLAKSGETLHFSVPLAAMPILALSAVLLAGFVAAVMMILASFARTFKEGQAFITPFYLLIMLPVMPLQTPGLEFSLGLAFIPIVNVVMLIRTVISGLFLWPQIVVTLAVSTLMILGAIRIATFVMRFEDVMLGSYSGSFKRFLTERVLKRGSKPQKIT